MYFILFEDSKVLSSNYFILHVNYKNKNVPALRAHSHRALRAQLTRLSAPRARDLIVALRARFFSDSALNARSYVLRIHLSLFFII